jgi:two-component system nitrate/nitrite response regulator NarL
MTLWETTREREADKTRDSGSLVHSHGRSERFSTAQPSVAASRHPDILLISPSILEREALSLVLERGGFAVRSAGADIKAISVLSQHAPTVILVEVPSEPEIAHQSWFEELRRVFPRTQLVLLAGTLNPDWLVLCRHANLAGYLTKASPTPVILRQLRLICDGECILPIAMLREIARMGTRIERLDRPRVETLTRRDVDILQHLVAGHPNKIIADKLQLAESTVKVAMKSVFAKIAVTNRTQAAVWALNHGFDKHARIGEFADASASAGNFR